MNNRKRIKITRDFLIITFRFLFIRPFLKKAKYGKKYSFAICCIFKNEAPFLKEWIEYHKMIGVEHFYLYNNNSSDRYYDVLKQYIEQGLVTLKLWTKDHAQMEAYKDFYDNNRGETQWISFLDPDEYICPIKGNNLKEWIRGFEKYPAILIYWKMFGTSGKMEHDKSKLVIEQYHVSWPNLYKVGKCLINTDYDIASFDAFTHHCPKLVLSFMGMKINIRPVNQFKIFITPDLHLSWLYNDNKASIQINHYWSKAWDIYNKKRQMTDVYFKKNPKVDLEYFYKHEYENTSVDYKIVKYLIKLKLQIILNGK